MNETLASSAEQEIAYHNERVSAQLLGQCKREGVTEDLGVVLGHLTFLKEATHVFFFG